MLYACVKLTGVVQGLAKFADCALVGVDEEDVDDCGDDVVGGLFQSYGCLYSDLDSLTFNADGQLTAILMKATKVFARYKFTSDNTAFYNQTGNRADTGAFTANQAAFFKFSGLTKERASIANKAKGSKKVFFIHFLNDGSGHTQGVDYNATKDEYRSSKEAAKVNPNVDSKTGDISSALEFNIVGVSKGFHPIDDTVIDIAYMDALI